MGLWSTTKTNNYPVISGETLPNDKVLRIDYVVFIHHHSTGNQQLPTQSTWKSNDLK